MPASASAPTFDAKGILWILGGTTVDPTLSYYPADAVSTAQRAGEVEIDIAPDVGCFPRWNALAFAPNGDLWVSIACPAFARAHPGLST